MRKREIIAILFIFTTAFFLLFNPIVSPKDEQEAVVVDFEKETLKEDVRILTNQLSIKESELELAQELISKQNELIEILEEVVKELKEGN